MNLSLLAEPAQTLSYMIAGYAVILGTIGAYLISLAIRRHKLNREKENVETLLKK
jgi:hypothetical protein